MKLSKITHICSLPTLANEVNASRIFKALLYFMLKNMILFMSKVAYSHSKCFITKNKYVN